MLWDLRQNFKSLRPLAGAETCLWEMLQDTLNLQPTCIMQSTKDILAFLSLVTGIPAMKDLLENALLPSSEGHYSWMITPDVFP